jgi:hypothetical protein
MARLTSRENAVRTRIMDQVLTEGTCPSSKELAKEFSLSVDELQEIYRALEPAMCVAISHGRHAEQMTFQDETLEKPTPAVGEIFYARPFATFENHYKVYVDVDGEQKWFAECAVESCAIPSMFPGKEVVVRSICRQTREPVEIIARFPDEFHYSPKTLRVHIGKPFKYFWYDCVGWCDYNSFFASEEAVKEWHKTHMEFKGVTKSPDELKAFLEFTLARGRLEYPDHLPFPLIPFLMNMKKCGFLKPMPVTGWNIMPESFYIPNHHWALAMKQHGYKFYLRPSLF